MDSDLAFGGLVVPCSLIKLVKRHKLTEAAFKVIARRIIYSCNAGQKSSQNNNDFWFAKALYHRDT